MAVRHGYGKIAGADALVFAYDTGDTVNSYKGEPTTNYADRTLAWGDTTQNDVIDTWSSGRVGTRLSNQPDSDGGLNALGAIGGNHTNTWIGQRTSLGAEVNGSYITFSVKLKASAPTTVSLRFYQPASGGMNTGTDVTIGTEWQTYSITVNNTSTSYVTNYSVHWIVNIKNTSNTVWFYKPQVEKKSHATPFVNGTRSATEGLKDLTGNTSIDLSNVSFDSNAQIDFDGSNDRVICEVGTALDSDKFTVEFLANPSISSVKEMIVKHSGLTGGIGTFEVYQNSLKVYGRHNGSTVTYTGDVFTLNSWHHIVATYDRQYFKIYVNGVEEASSLRSVSTAFYNSPLVIGGYYDGNYSFNGQLDAFKIYNRALTAGEIKNNYSHYKNRFGI